MGFCFLGNAALAAKTALDAGARVAVLDFDVHHGNGTQALLWNEPNAFFASTHVLGDWPNPATVLGSMQLGCLWTGSDTENPQGLFAKPIAGTDTLIAP